MTQPDRQKTIRSYRLVFRRRWRVFRIQGWRIPLPGGIELRLLGYWIACLAASLLLSGAPILGLAYRLAPTSLRLAALPLAAAWLLARTDIDGRPPHRALAGLIAWRLRPRSLAGLRRCPPPGTELAPLGRVLIAPDLRASRYPRGEVRGPAHLLLRYPLRAERDRARFGRRRWRLRPRADRPLDRGKTIEIAAGESVEFTDSS